MREVTESERTSQDPLAAIIRRAAFLRERLETTKGRSGQASTDNAESLARLERLAEAIAGDDADGFERWMRWNKLEMNRLIRALPDKGTTGSGREPVWAQTLRAIVAASPGQAYAGDQRLPFQDVLLPALAVAREKLVAQLDGRLAETWDYPPHPLLSIEAYASLERHLLARLSTVSAAALGELFARNRPAGASFLLSIQAHNPAYRGNLSNDYYRAFVSDLLDRDLRPVFDRYPVLGRFMATLVDQWVSATAEFLRRLQS